MVKKFFSIALLLTVCAFAQVEASAPVAKNSATSAASTASTASTTAPVTASKPAETKSVAATPACTESTFCKAKSAVTDAFNTAKEFVVTKHPYALAAAAVVAASAAAYNYSETVRGWFGVSADDASKCPCTKRDQLAA